MAITSGISYYFSNPGIDFSAGGSFDMDVRAFSGGVLNDYGDFCPIIINATPEAQDPRNDEIASAKINDLSTDLVSALYPNPNDGAEFVIQITDLVDSHSAVFVEVTDMTGKVAHYEQFSVKGASANLMVKPTARLSSGSYIVRIYNDAISITEKLVVR